MTFTQSVKTCLTTKYVDFKGRATRSEFWWFILFYFVIMFALIFLYVGVTIILSLKSISDSVISAFIMLVIMALMLPTLSVMVRRLHDIGKSGWWLLINVIPWIGGIVLIVLWMKPSKTPEIDEWAQEETILNKETAAEEAVVVENCNYLSPFTLPLTLGFVFLFPPFAFWVMKFPMFFAIGEGIVVWPYWLRGVRWLFGRNSNGRKISGFGLPQSLLLPVC